MTVTEEPVRTGTRSIASTADTSKAWWFLGTLAVLRNPDGAPRTPAVIELTVPPGGSPPLHRHDVLDDSFLLLDGQLVVRCGDETLVANHGTYVVLPQGVPHTFRVTSRTPARMLLIHANDSFLQFIEEIGTPTDERRLPMPGETSVDPDAVARASARHGAPLIGASLEEDEARSALPAIEGPAPLGAINHVALTVTDVAASERWYTQAFDLVRIDGEVDDDGNGHIAMVSPSGGWVLSLESAPSAGVDHVAFTCIDRDAVLEWRDALTRRGVNPGTVTDAPYGSGFVVRDPDGVQIELFARGGE